MVSRRPAESEPLADRSAARVGAAGPVQPGRSDSDRPGAVMTARRDICTPVPQLSLPELTTSFLSMNPPESHKNHLTE
eukprot:748014-Hanusia_phi.AAC.3